MVAVSEARAARSRRPAHEDLRRLAERLRLDAVGIVGGTDGLRHVTWWAAPDAAPLPAHLDDLVDGHVPGWLVCPLDTGTIVFGRTTPSTPSRAEEVLRAIGSHMEPDASAPLLPPPPSPEGGESPTADADEGSVTLGGTVLPFPTAEDPAPEPAAPEGLLEALGALAADTGFECARLFARTGTSWELVERAGPRRPWHPVLDPATLGPTDGPLVYPDIQSAPGVGTRLAALGCASAAVLPLADGPCVVLDSGRRAVVRDVAGRAQSHLARIAALTAASDAGARERTMSELSAVEMAAQAVRRVLEDEGSTATDLMRELREAMGAHELFHLVERRDEVEVASDPESGWPRTIPRELRATLASLDAFGPVDAATARRLGLELGAVSPHLGAVLSKVGSPLEALVAGWRDGPGLSHGAMRAIAQMAGGARASVESRRRTVDSMLTRERTRWADEIHDGLTQAVTTAVLELEAMERQIANDPRRAIRSLSATKAEIRGALADLRTLLFDLQREDPPDSSTAEPLTKYVNDVVKRWRLPARVSIEGDLREVPKPLLGAAYVVIREGLANAAKHAAASKVSVWVNARPEEMTVEVADAGRGFDVGEKTSDGGPSHHFGLGMMHRRVSEVGGTLDIKSEPGRGTRIVARLPIRGGTP